MTRDPLSAELPDVFAPSASPLTPDLPAEAFAPRPAARPSPRRSARATQDPRTGHPATLRSGTIVDKYRIEELLGVGGFAAVYRATHLLLRSTVALKLLRADVVARRPNLAIQLLQEARFAARIEHRNVVRVFDVTHTPAITYIVMELIRGPSLARLIADRGPLPVGRIAQIGIDTIDGLAAGLAQGLIHRDIKPPNILLDDAGVARIVDLGLANPIHDRDEGPLRDSTLVGTRGYMSPEQLADPRAVDFRSDIYSLGVTLREAATGEPPSYRRRRDEPPPTALPAALAPIVGWMVAHDPADRPGSYRELRDALVVLADASASASASRTAGPSGLPTDVRPPPTTER
ncbi:MAG TPA: serine/threonine-protein kinase [Kofleriaceae bacterium]|nr:serine/threonine-protein kinase [Kofleriaceae bacterium]